MRRLLLLVWPRRARGHMPRVRIITGPPPPRTPSGPLPAVPPAFTAPPSPPSLPAAEPGGDEAHIRALLRARGIHPGAVPR